MTATSIDRAFPRVPFGKGPLKLGGSGTLFFFVRGRGTIAVY
jgi:hypothetical protein